MKKIIKYFCLSLALGYFTTSNNNNLSDYFDDNEPMKNDFVGEELAEPKENYNVSAGENDYHNNHHNDHYDNYYVSESLQGRPYEEVPNVIEYNNDIIDKEIERNKKEVIKKLEFSDASKWENYMYPWKIFPDEGALLLNFVNSDLVNLLKYFEATFKVIFITDDAIQPALQGSKSLLGSKINFTCNKPLARQEAWNIFITLLELAGVTLQPGSMDRVYRVVPLAKESPFNYTKGPMPVFIGVDYKDLPADSNVFIHYVYIVKNTSMVAVKNLIQKLQSASSPDPIEIPELNGILFTDRIFNIKTVMSIIEEIDKVTMPESVVIIKLNHVEAVKIAELYKLLVKEESGGAATPRIIGSSRNDLVTHFDPMVRIIPEARTNSLILLGNKTSIERIKNFILDYEDKSNKLPYLPVKTYQLKYTNATALADILQQAVEFKGDTEIGKLGGTLNGQKFFSSNITIIPEPSTNTLIITASDEDYKNLYPLIKEIDVEQKQVIIDVILVSVDNVSQKALGAQIRNSPGALGSHINTQTGTFSSDASLATNTQQNSNGATRLLGNLLDLISGQGSGSAVPAGTTIMTLGSDANGIWGILRMLQSYTETKVISNPFLMSVNNYQSSASFGETRRIAESTVLNQNQTSNAFSSDTAQTQITVTPQINENGKIALTISVEIGVFTDSSGDEVAAGNKKTQTFVTSVLVPDGEIIAIGGLNYETIFDERAGVPWLSQIPIIGNLFGRTEQKKAKSSLLFLLQPRIVKGREEVKKEFDRMSSHFSTNVCSDSTVDPLQRWFFNDPFDKSGRSSVEEIARDRLYEFETGGISAHV